MASPQAEVEDVVAKTVAEDSSSSDSEDEDTIIKGASGFLPEGSLRKTEDPDEQLEREIEEEADMLEEATKMKGDENLHTSLRKLKFLKTFSRANFQDILPLVIDGRKFVIDGDGLLMMALNTKGLSLTSGGQTLHVVYLVEKFLLTFLSKRLDFIVVFFKVYDTCWSNFPLFNLARSSLMLHMMNNLKNISVLSMQSLWSEEFSSFIKHQRPTFIMMFTGLHSASNILKVKSDTEPEKLALKYLEFITYAQGVCSELLCLNAVDIESVQSTSQCLMATVHIHSVTYKGVRREVEDLIHSMDEEMSSVEKPEEQYPYSQEDIRKNAFILSAASILNSTSKDSRQEKADWIKIILLYGALLENTPLKLRCFRKSQEHPELASLISEFQSEMASVVNELGNSVKACESLNFRTVSDLWHGIFFEVVSDSLLQLGEVNCDDLGKAVATQYEKLISEVNQLLKDFKISPYPIKPSCIRSPTSDQIVDVTPPACEKVLTKLKLCPINCELISKFCGDITSKEKIVSEMDSSIMQIDSLEISPLTTLKPMADEFDRIVDSAAETALRANTVNKRFAQSDRNRMARFMTVYGLSLEGRNSVKGIVTENPKSNQSQKKKDDKPDKPKKTQPKGKQSKKDKIIEDNMKRKSDELQKQIKDRLKNFSVNFASLIQRGDNREALGRCDIELQRAGKFSEFVIEILFYKAKASFNLWLEEIRKKPADRDFTGAKELFLVVREILKTSESSNLPLATKQKVSVSAWLHDLGFSEIASIWNLPEPSKGAKKEYSVGMNHVEFQMAHLGPDLVRETGGKPDPRADGFIPDPWQVKLFDVIDKNQSAVVIAPTSSGKTYASYYCMEKVIRESDDGVVVYVCPTKALVNQVHATIYARFKKTLPAGKVLQGIFTRDFRQNVLNCQILTTVPDCMEMLLLSPRFHSWTKRIKYVIFDEVHCLAGQSGGLSWENSILLVRCPYLALSATIHEPETFCAWMQRAEEFKKIEAQKLGFSDRSHDSYKVTLVVHDERHNHLKKNIMLPDGSIHHVHPYSFLDPITLKECQGIPRHISLSPDESLELFYGMKKIISLDIEKFSPEKYFKSLCPTGFLSMQAVRKFSEELRTTLEKEPMDKVVKVLTTLQTFDYESCETGDEFVYRNIPTVLGALKARGMLPALVFTYDRRLVQALPAKLLRYLRDIDDFTEDEETDISSGSEEEDASKKSSNKGNRRFKGKRFKKKLGLLRGPSILKSPGSLRGEGFTDEKVMEYIEHRLIRSGYSSQMMFPCMLRRGLGRHYPAMNNRERSAVEMLFRLKVLNLVTATGTLALGIHMPCKTVVVAGDSPYLNPLEFNQMSGRAGRRGFDKEGNVILYGLHKRKMQTLITGNLPVMKGNFPLRASLILRLMLLVSDITYEGKVSSDSTNEALARSYILLENGLLYQSSSDLKEKMKYYFFFVIQFLVQQGLVNTKGYPQQNAQLMVNLHSHEPGNFAFNYLLTHGVLEDMCQCDKKGALTQESILDLVLLFNFLFARLPLSYHLFGRKKQLSEVVLPPLPSKVLMGLQKYNAEVLQIFSHYFECITSDVEEKYGDEKNLPLSQVNVQPDGVLGEEIQRDSRFLSTIDKQSVINKVCSVFSGLSGNTDQDLFPTTGDIMHIRDDINVKVVPTIELDFLCNSYAYDFYKHGNKSAICLDNGLRSGDDFELLKDFRNTMESIHSSLVEILEPKSKLLSAMEEISTTFANNFNKAYYILPGA